MTELHDNTGTYDASTGRFTPTMEGWYQFNFGGWASENDTSGADRYAIAFAKNGSLTYISGGAYCAVDSPLNGAAQSIYLDANDYVELWAYSSVATTWGGSSHHLWWEGYWVSS